MNKKFLSALFLGSIIAAGGTFTACSDYDDDIDSLNQRVDAVEQAVTDLQNAIKGGSMITNVQSTDKGVVVTLSNGSSIELTNGLDGAAGAPGSVVTIGPNGNWYIDGVDSGKPSRGEAGAPGTAGEDGADGTDGKYYIPGENGYWIEVTPNADGTETKEQTSMSWTPDGTVTAVWDTANGVLLLSNVEGHTGVLSISLTDDLKSLVFVPEMYYQGIEAMEAKTFNYTYLTVGKVDADGNYNTDKPVSKEAVSMTPGLVAYYHMNPTSADWKDIKALTYISDDKAYTRAGDVVKAVITDWEGENGVLTVHSQLKDGVIKDIDADGEVTVLALQANYSSKAGNDTIITSDYAAVKASNKFIAALAHAEAWHSTHLYATAQQAIDNTADYTIEWNSEGMDVAELVQTHLSDAATGGTEAAWDENAADGMVEDYGFKYSYELVGYHVGDNKTSESAHAVMNGSVLKPCMPVDGKQPAWDNATQNKAENGREPLVRVILTDTISNRIAAVGYIKFHITDEATKNEVIYNVTFPFDDVYTVNCTEDATTLKIEWHDFEEEILAKLIDLGISKEEFHNDFTLDGGTANATQYNGITVTSTATTKKGVVAQTTSDTGAEETQVIKWTLKNNEAYQLFKNNASVSVNIRYSKQVSAGIYQYVYVTLTWTPKERNVAPAGELSNSDKIQQYWYDTNSNVPGSGYSDIHANVETVGQNGADDEFKSDILNTFVGNDVNVSGVNAVYTAFQDARLTKDFTFVNPQASNLTPVTGNSGTKYDITVSADGKTLLANVAGAPSVKQNVVRINGSFLEFFGQDDATYSFARDILNYADHKALNDKETFTAQLQVEAANCDYVPFELANNTFFAKFLRPISIEDPHETNFVDATTGGASSPLKLTFIDWRDHNFDNADQTKGENYYAYYNVKSIECLTSQIKTDLNGTSGKFDKLLSAVTSNIVFSFDEPTTAQIQGATHYLGTLNYENNGTTVGNFQIQVPFDVTYDWGTIRVYVVCKISQTEAN